MARIPDDQLVRLKQDIAVQRLTEMRGITLKRPRWNCCRRLIWRTLSLSRTTPPLIPKGDILKLDSKGTLLLWASIPNSRAWQIPSRWL